MKYFQLLILSLFLFSLASCSDELEQLPETSILADNYYTTAANVETTITATYNSLQELYRYTLIAYGEIPSDNAYIQAPNSNGSISPLEDFTWTSTTGFVGDIWEYAYEGIFNANTVLEEMEKVTYDSDSLKNIRMGEVLFLRAFLYNQLTTIYGDIPLVLSTYDDPTQAFNDTRTGQSEIDTRIESDLLEAISLLPADNEPGRVDAYGARAVLARFYMRNQDFANAQTQLASIVNSGKYALVSLENLYGVENEGNAEDVFSIQYTSDLNGRTEGNSYYYNYTQPDNEGGLGAIAMEQSLYNLYTEADLRRNLVNVSSNVYYLNKWTPSPSTSTGDGGDNHFVVRYADVLLLYAECLNENNQTAMAATYLNMVRNRAGLENSNATNQTSMSMAIALERRLELAGEGHRWFDLLRTNMALETMNNFFASQGENINVEDKRVFIPIPQSEIDITNMVQTTGY